MTVLLGVDLGTSSVRAAVLEAGRGLLAVEGEPYPIRSPSPGWAEQDPEEWWHAACVAIQKALARAGVGPRQVRAVGLSGQMHGLVLVDSSGRALRPAIIWPDRRSRDECRQMEERLGADRLYRITGLPAATGFFGPSLLWVRRHEPTRYLRVARAVLPKDYLRYRLTGQWATDVTDGSGTLLFDVAARAWSWDVVRSLGLREDLLPPVLESTAASGEVCAGGTASGLRSGTLVAAGGGDQMMAAAGAGVLGLGVVGCAVGTGGQVFTTLDRVVLDPKRRLHTLCHALPGAWFLMGAILAAGLGLSWVRDTFGEGDFGHLTELAAQAEPGSRGLLFLPYLVGERTPHMDPAARGCWVGLTLAHTRAHLVRSVLEGVAFALRDALEAVEECGITVKRLVASGGGARSPLWLQIQADVYGRALEVRPDAEHSAVGAALVAGVASGLFCDVAESAASVPTIPVRIVEPRRDAVGAYQRLYDVYRSLYPALRGTFRRLGTAS